MLHPKLEQVRLSSSTAYKEMLKSKLSLVLTIPMGFDFDDLDVPPSSIRSETIFGAQLTTEGICTINQLFDHIMKNIKTEGIFRKSGVQSRQGRLQADLCTGSTLSVNLDSSAYSIHDVCCVVKKFISNLPQPLLLGDRLLELWLQVQPSLGATRRLEAVQLLFLLLPDANRLFFTDLIKLLSAVAAVQDNKMTASSLATIFTPILFLPKNVQPSMLAAHSPTLTAALSFMISSGTNVLEPPVSLLVTADQYLCKLRTATRAQAKEQAVKGSGKNGMVNSMMSTTALIPPTQFCAHVEAPKNYTEQMLAELRSQVDAMPTSNVKPSQRKLIKSVKKKADSMNTPLPKLKRDKVQQAMIRSEMKRSAKASKAAKLPNSAGLAHTVGSALRRTFGFGSRSSGGSRNSNSSNASSDTILRTPKSGRKRRSISESAISTPLSSSAGTSTLETISSPKNQLRQPSSKAPTPPLRTSSRLNKFSISAVVPSPSAKPPASSEDCSQVDIITNDHFDNSSSSPLPDSTTADVDDAAPRQMTPHKVVINVSLVSLVGQQERQQPSSSLSQPPIRPSRSGVSIKSLPPLVPPKPSPRTVSLKRKASVYSLPPLPQTTSKLATQSNGFDGNNRRSISAQMQPVMESVASKRRHLGNFDQKISSPLVDLSNQDKVRSQIVKFESLTKGNGVSYIPRLTRSVSRKPSIPKSLEEEEEDENAPETYGEVEYVLLSKMAAPKAVMVERTLKMNMNKVTSTNVTPRSKEQITQINQLRRPVTRSNSSTSSPRSLVPVVVDGPHVSRTASDRQQKMKAEDALVRRVSSRSRTEKKKAVRRLEPKTPL